MKSSWKKGMMLMAEAFVSARLHWCWTSLGPSFTKVNQEVAFQLVQGGWEAAPHPVVSRLPTLEQAAELNSYQDRPATSLGT